jgi:hypothetical protein
MSLIDLFTPPKVRIPARARRVTLIDVETRDEAVYRQRIEALKKARAAITARRGPKPPTDLTAAEKLRREKAAAASRDWYERNKDRARDAARERMRKARETNPQKFRERNAEQYRKHAEQRKADMRARYAAMTPEEKRIRNNRNRRLTGQTQEATHG